jgi:hypothetical protein
MTIAFTFLLLCLLPILLVILFRGTLIERKQRTLREDLERLKASETPLVQSKGGVRGIEQNVLNIYSPTFLLPPAVILSLLYLPGFLLCYSLLNVKLGSKSSWPFYVDLVNTVRPIIFAFIGVYLFNLGSMVRRLYLSDLTEHVFWGSLNRLLLSVGTALVVMTSFHLSGGGNDSDSFFDSDVLFFGIGFLANAFLQAVLQAGLHIGKVKQSKSEDLPLQLVRGINIWKEYRLEEEGIEHVENLATADVIDLAVKTHYPLRTLIDWVDQALIISRFGKDKTDKLWENAIPVSAIELAWQSPENSESQTNAAAIAQKLGVEPLFMGNQMNALFEDNYVQTLWTLWQTRPEGKGYPASSPT